MTRGPAWIKPLVGVSAEAKAFLESLGSATKTGSIGRAIRTLGLDPQATSENIFRMYDESEIKLAGSLDKTIYFRVRPLEKAEIEAMSASISQVVNSRLDRFDEFLALVESEVDPTAALNEKFG